ncbi:MAG: hypothetical protein V7668_20340 [Cereibacter changlensis]|jgi:hypothetical protein|uniref:Lipoprotein n=2 Tax=Cereibacter changlensis TaxID=402884 RepID=A0A2T4JWI0_9RHOB|nr:hypothetical protein [Cereibacter changlensis]PTE22268.1 hypothetical protein C5F48_08160 [Cereibacter changlensis JA139]PZX53041.1 hypothetical protein LX76_02674 [Cereibacter changlensis]TKA97288.1 hypothetical protein FAZ78_06925 [Cereibacter changlensis]
MKTPLLAGLALVLALGACGSRLNPMNWFGGARETAPVASVEGPVTRVDTRPLVAQVISLDVKRMQGGAIVRAVGLPPTQGFWQADLVARPLVDGVQVYEFRVSPPPVPNAVSTQRSREISVATFISSYQLEGIRQITVQSAGNALTSGR